MTPKTAKTSKFNARNRATFQRGKCPSCGRTRPQPGAYVETVGAYGQIGAGRNERCAACGRSVDKWTHKTAPRGPFE